MAHIDYYFATNSTYTYFAGKRLEEIAEKHGATITYKPLDVVALFKRSGGVDPVAWHPSRLEYRRQEFARLPQKLGMPFNPQAAYRSANPAPSAYAIIAAQAAGGGDVGELAHSFCRAMQAEDKDISDDSVIRDCLDRAGFDPNLADSGLLLGAETYANNLEDAAVAGAIGAPFYITDTDQRFWGQDRLEDLDLYLSNQ